MREIKFRFWDIHTKEMYDVGDIIFGVKHGMTSSDRVNYVIDPYGSRYRVIGYEAELIQYTGLKDCKGTEIYEGDIVKWKIFPEYKDPTYIMDAVVYRGGAFALEKRIELLGGIAPYRRLEVIGNIYQHPELLKEEKSNEQ